MVAQDVDLAVAVVGGHLDAGDEGDLGVVRELAAGLGYAFEGVVVGDGDEAQGGLAELAHELRRRAGAVGGGGVHVEVD